MSVHLLAKSWKQSVFVKGGMLAEEEAMYDPLEESDLIYGEGKPNELDRANARRAGEIDDIYQSMRDAVEEKTGSAKPDLNALAWKS